MSANAIFFMAVIMTVVFGGMIYFACIASRGAEDSADNDGVEEQD